MEILAAYELLWLSRLMLEEQGNFQVNHNSARKQRIQYPVVTSRPRKEYPPKIQSVSLACLLPSTSAKCQDFSHTSERIVKAQLDSFASLSHLSARLLSLLQLPPSTILSLIQLPRGVARYAALFYCAESAIIVEHRSPTEHSTMAI